MAGDRWYGIDDPRRGQGRGGTVSRPPRAHHHGRPAEETTRAGGGRRAAARRRRRRSRARTLRRVGIGLAVLVVAAAAFGGYSWYRVDSGISVAPLHAGTVTGVVAEKPDSLGRLPVNVLVLGDSGSHAAVDMLVHVAADRSNATVISIPRGDMASIPRCTAKGQVYPAQPIASLDSALNVSPGCQVDAVEQLSHIQIDHFIEVDAAGALRITDTLGGVPFCVTGPVDDPTTNLRLPAGTSVVTGATALALLRSRDAFDDSSEFYSTEVAHQYLSSLIRHLRAAGSLTNPNTLTRIVDTASRSVTVDQGLGSVHALAGLADELAKVPTDRITFLTAPTQPYWPQPGEVQPAQPQDDELFSMVAHDQPVTAANPASTSSGGPAPSPAAPTTVGRVVVANGTDAVGRAGEVASTLESAGFGQVGTANYDTDGVTQTQVHYATGQRAAAEAVAGALHLPASAVVAGATAGGDVELVIGGDFTSGTYYTAPHTTGNSTLPSALASAADAENAADTSVCAHSRTG